MEAIRQVPDIPRIFTAVAEWAACTLYIVMFNRRYNLLKQILISLAFLLGLSSWLMVSKKFPLAFWMPAMALAALMMFIYIFMSLKMKRRDAAYYTIRAFVLAEMMASLEWQLYVFFFYETGTRPFVEKFIFPIIIYAAILITIYFVEKDRLPSDMELNISVKEFITAFITGIIIFGVSNISFVYSNTPFSVQYPMDVLYTRTLTDIGGFAILYTHYVICCQSRAWHEIAALKNVLQNQYVQYRMSRESINLINQKYHDLKHQINALRSMDDPDKKNEYLDQMENSIKTYEAQYKTGNVVLDTIFTSKALYCQKHSILFKCVVEGSLLDFVDVMDLSSIFGNALDNAIEYEKRIPDKEKRLVRVTVCRQKGFVLSKFENYYEGGELKMRDGLPETTKPDVAYHGYGLKSIKTTAEHYGGTATVNVANEWFILNVLLPLR